MARRNNSPILPQSFYKRDTITVARELLGCILVHRVAGKRIAGRIVETEAYLGVKDRACHTYGGRKTERVRSMYLDGGHAYIYLIYGMYHCFNVVTRTNEEPEAVLVRAIEPVEDVETMFRLRYGTKPKGNTTKSPLRRLADGPGKLCLAMGIDRRLDGVNLTKSDLFIEKERKDAPEIDRKILASPRIGVDYAGEAAFWPLRFQLMQK